MNTPAFSVNKLLPQGGALEQEQLNLILSLNRELKEEFSVDDEIRLANLRMGTSETQAPEQWISAMSFMQDRLDKAILPYNDILNINFLLSGHKGLRKERIIAGTCEFPAHESVESLMEEFQQRVQQISEPISRAAFIYQALCSIHPFVDGNGRTARLIADHALISNGFAPLIFPAPTMAYVVPEADEKHPHLLALKRVRESTAWVAKLFHK